MKQEKLKTPRREEPLSTSADWSYDLLDAYYHEIEDIALNDLNLNVYPNQLEIISSEQMLEAYASNALPVYYDHWGTGMRFVQEMEAYKRGEMGLAYEVVINSNPCIAYLMEENTMMMQVLVTAHASFGHNHFFKNNYLFKQWTDAEAIVDYLVYAKNFIRECEEKYGPDEVEEVLDACHALSFHGVHKYKRPRELTKRESEDRKKEREEWERQQVNVLWSTVPVANTNKKSKEEEEKPFPASTQENLLYFIEKNAPNLDTWKRETIRIVRKLGQYFYPQYQTKTMNEGFACFVHYHIVQELYDRGVIGDGYLMEFLISHTNITLQQDFDQCHYSGLNPYSLGFAMFMDIKRVSMEPTDEDKEWFKNKTWVGNGKWLENILWAAENFKDESFIMEFLSPKVMRDFHFFAVMDDDRDSMLEVTAIHNDNGYRRIREALSEQNNIGYMVPEIHVAKGGVDLWGDRSLTLEHVIRNRRPLHEEDAVETLKHAKTLWGYNVKLASIDENEKVKALFEIREDKQVLDVFID